MLIISRRYNSYRAQVKYVHQFDFHGAQVKYLHQYNRCFLRRTQISPKFKIISFNYDETANLVRNYISINFLIRKKMFLA
mmetsp:Transcript_17014/g.33891  ORF Transcript_17014/g.33891 Transcript_17014/m.33891 type:complete len:80 (-) Transcript_17014:499-738(-)